MAIHRIKKNSSSALLKTPGKHPDGGGLYLQVGSIGSASWVYQFSLKKKVRGMSIGPAATFTLAEARAAHLEARRLRDRGIDPIEERGGARAIHGPARVAGETFGEVALQYIAQRSVAWRWRDGLEGREAGEWKRRLIDNAALAKLAIPAVTDKAITEALKDVPDVSAKRARVRIASVLKWLKDGKPRVERRPEAEKNHLAAMSWTAVPDFMRVLRDNSSVASKPLMFTILTAARTGETLGAIWGEIDGNVWTIPGSRMKAGREHTVPLSPQALAVLPNRGDAPDGARIFPLDGSSMSRLMRDIPESSGATVHGFRSSFTDWAAEQPGNMYPRELREIAIAHAVGDKVEQAYRRTKLIAKRREMMEAWAKFATKPGARDIVDIEAWKASRAGQ